MFQKELDIISSWKSHLNCKQLHLLFGYINFLLKFKLLPNLLLPQYLYLVLVSKFDFHLQNQLDKSILSNLVKSKVLFKQKL